MEQHCKNTNIVPKKLKINRASSLSCGIFGEEKSDKPTEHQTNSRLESETLTASQQTEASSNTSTPTTAIASRGIYFLGRSIMDMITFIATNVVNSFSSAEEDNETADNSIPNDQEIEQIYKKYKIKKSATEFQFRAFYRKHATDMDIDSIGYKLYLLQLEQDIDKICTYKGWDRSSFKKRDIHQTPEKKNYH